MPQKIFHTVIYLKIPFHPYQPTFGRDEFFFSFFFQNTVPLFPERLNTEKKTLHQMCYCDVRTLQTKSTMYKQCKQNSLNFAKKVLVIKLDPPKISTNRRAWSLVRICFEFVNTNSINRYCIESVLLKKWELIEVIQRCPHPPTLFHQSFYLPKIDLIRFTPYHRQTCVSNFRGYRKG